MKLSELNTDDRFCLEHLGVDNWSVIEKETIPAGFTEETFYRILNNLTNEQRVIEKPEEVEVFHVLLSSKIKSAKLFIKVKYDSKIDNDTLKSNGLSELPIGYIHQDFFGKMEESETWMPVDGRALKKEDYPELYVATGDNYCVEEKVVKTPTLMERIVNCFVGKILKSKTIKQRNCNDNEFRIPDMRAKYIRGF